MQINAEYVSEWSETGQVVTPCVIDLSTGQVDPVTSDFEVEGFCTSEYVIVKGSQFNILTEEDLEFIDDNIPRIGSNDVNSIKASY